MPRLLLVRHGQAEAGVDSLDPGLSPLGVEQAESTARALTSSGATRLLVSPLRRTRETATPIAAALQLEPEITPAVGEVFDPDMPVAERQSMIGPFMQGRWSVQNERLLAWRQRLYDTFTAIASDTLESAVIVSHYIAIASIVGRALDDDRVVPLAIPTASITTDALDGARLELVAAGSLAHLDERLITGAHTALAGN
jgi:probable phosphoglycerate mutase